MSRQVFLIKKGSLEEDITPKLYSAIDAFVVMKMIGEGKNLEDVFEEVEVRLVVKPPNNKIVILIYQPRFFVI